MCSHCWGVNSEDLDSYTSARNSEGELRPNRVFKSLSSELMVQTSQESWEISPLATWKASVRGIWNTPLFFSCSWGGNAYHHVVGVPWPHEVFQTRHTLTVFSRRLPSKPVRFTVLKSVSFATISNPDTTPVFWEHMDWKIWTRKR